MRSASRKPKTLRGKPSIPANTQLARESLNNVERDYRTRLKVRFEKLLRAVQESMFKNETTDEDGSVRDDYRFSRGEVLDAARQRILALEEEKRRLTTRVEILNHNLMVNRRRQTVAKM
uniref:BHLH domain-containing protein n=3 Tax=Fusarium oxysporum TaxID=5507 RepID=A0A0D2Y1P8_FUSOF